MKISKLLIACLMLTSTTLTAAMYKWVDSHNNVQYGEIPPDGVQAVEITPPPPPSNANPEQKRLDDALKQYDTENAKKELERDKVQKEAEEAKVKATNCLAAKAALQNLEDHPRVRSTDATGNVYVLTAEQHEQEVLKAKDAINHFCTPGTSN